MKYKLSLLVAFGVAVMWALSYVPISDGANATVMTLVAAPSNGTNEVQTLTFDNNITGGTFQLNLTGSKNKSVAITWTATDATLVSRITSALEGIAEIGSGGATAAAGTLSGGHGTVTVTFAGNKTAKMNMPLLVVTNSLTGTTHTLTVAETTPGVTATGRDAVAGTMAVDQVKGAVYWTTSNGPNVNWRQSVAAPTPTPTPTPTPSATVTPTATPTP